MCDEGSQFDAGGAGSGAADVVVAEEPPAALWQNRDDWASDIESAPVPDAPTVEELAAEEDHLLIADFAPATAPRGSGKSGSGSALFKSLAISIALHVVIAWIAIAFFLHAFAASFYAKAGDGAAAGDLVSDAREGQLSEGVIALPHPPMPVDAPQQMPPMQAPSSESEAAPIPFADAPIPDPQAQEDEPSFIGPALMASNKEPIRPKHAPSAMKLSLATVTKSASTPAPSQHSGAVASAPRAAEVVGKKHVYTNARPAGAGGSGTRNGSDEGIDSRGLTVPAYPLECKRRGEEGLVQLGVQVLANGSVGNVKVLDDAGFPRLAEAAVNAIRHDRFVPATYDGVPIPLQLTVPYRFVLR